MVDFDYIKTLGLQLVAGRDFSKEQTTDKDHAFILNETAVKEFGFGTPQQALGKKCNGRSGATGTPIRSKWGRLSVW
ncbi:ABC transporter permease [Hymenobacter humi]|uniref:ABC transporter permease n=1 Tax=Hymenobacter humi TaxID=1411620 RepID=A0ABW2U427_9BACT